MIFLGDDLGLDSDYNKLNLPPMNPLSSSHKTAEDYVFVHTDSHREFMDLLLEKRKQLESNISSRQRDLLAGKKDDGKGSKSETCASVDTKSKQHNAESSCMCENLYMLALTWYTVCLMIGE